MNNLSSIPRTTCFICHESDLSDEIASMNSRGWTVTSATRNANMKTEFIVQAAFVDAEQNFPNMKTSPKHEINNCHIK